MFGVGSARWREGPIERGVAHEFSLMQVSGVGVVVDEVKIRGNGVNSGTPRSDMVTDGMTSKKHTQDRSNTLSREALEPHVCSRVRCATRKMCACVRAVRCYLYTPPSRSWQLPLSGREIC